MNARTLKTGLTRLFVVAWVLVAMLGMLALYADADLTGEEVGVVLLVCFIFPGLLLSLLRWTFDGFTKRAQSEPEDDERDAA